MSPAEFLHALWPSQGYYVIATPFKLPDSKKVVFAHKVFSDIDSAATFVDAQKLKRNIFFGVHTIKHTRVWNPKKIDYKTGKPGAYEIRTQRNMHSAQCFFFDLDVGKPRTYPDQASALTDLKNFCSATKLPKPTIVSSGNGLHIYWRLSEAISSDEWVTHAAKLKQLAKHYSLLFDPTRTTDTSSVLRVAGTYNLKDKDNPREVQLLTMSAPTDTSKFLAMLDDAMIQANLTAPVVQHHNPALDILGSNTDEISGPPVAFKALVTACPQMQRITRLQGNVSEPEWYASLNLVRYVANPQKFIHLISAGHPEYSAEETDAKVRQLENKGIKPTRCDKLEEVCGTDLCNTCKFKGKVKSPIVAARYRDEAPAPVIPPPPDIPEVTPVELPPPPYPYSRVRGKGILMEVMNADGEPGRPVVIYHNDLYPIMRTTNQSAKREQQVWCVNLPRVGPQEFTLDADALYDSRKLFSNLANNGIYPANENITQLRGYMIAYINELQKLIDAEQQYPHLGWTDDRTKFILPDKILSIDGKVKPATLSLGASRAAAAIHKQGSLERQIELLNFYNHASYIPNQFCILASLGAPIFYATGQHGVIINMSGPPGASKSTTLYTAASLWGVPELYPINGTTGGATTRARDERITVLANLPICVDEITHMQAKDAAQLALSVTQPSHRLRLTVEGVERAHIGSYKATMLLSTANTSLYTLLSSERQDSTAESMRVLEIQFDRGAGHKKYEADEFLHDLKENFGHIGEVFMKYVVSNRDAVTTRVREMMRALDIKLNIKSGERFWTAAMSASLVAGEIARELGLISYDIDAIREWLIFRQLPSMRGVITDQYSNPVGVLAEYLEYINGNIIVVNNHKDGNLPTVIRAPHNQMLAHYDWAEGRMWILKKAFRDYCIKVGANYNKIVEDLAMPRTCADGHKRAVITLTNARKILGARTEYAKSQSWCLCVDMRHPEIAGTADLHLVQSLPKYKGDDSAEATG